MQSALRRMRIVAPSDRVTENANPDELRTGDVIEILDNPLYRIDPKTRQPLPEFQQFHVTMPGHLTPVASATPAIDMKAVRRALRIHLQP